MKTGWGDDRRSTAHRPTPHQTHRVAQVPCLPLVVVHHHPCCLPFVCRAGHVWGLVMLRCCCGCGAGVGVAPLLKPVEVAATCGMPHVAAMLGVMAWVGLRHPLPSPWCGR